MRLAFSEGNEKDIRLKSADFSFEMLEEYLSVCQKGDKHEKYFVRGGNIEYDENYISGSGKEWGSGHFRCDRALLSASILVIDGDEGIEEGCPPVSNMKWALDNLGINYILYTTHSHLGKDKNKYRVIIPTDREYIKSELKANIDSLLDSLDGLGVGIKRVKEMYTWSQPWFIPTRSDPEDGIFEFCSSGKGRNFEIIEEVVSKGSKDSGEAIGEALREKSRDRIDKDKGGETGSKSYTKLSLDSILEVLSSGKGEVHAAQLNYTTQLIKDGMSSAWVKAHLRSVMVGWKGDNRWKARYDDIDRLVDSAAGKAEGSGMTASEMIDKLKEDNEDDRAKQQRAFVADSFTGQGYNRDSKLHGGRREGPQVDDQERKGYKDVGLNDVEVHNSCDREQSDARLLGRREDEVISESNSNDSEVQQNNNEGHSENSRGKGDGTEIKGDEERISADLGLPWPPGQFGELCKCHYRSADYPNKMVSIATGLLLVAAIAGRRFNINGTGLNIYLTLLMPTGGGKSHISKEICRILGNEAFIGVSNMFVGSKSFTGPKALMKEMNEKRCMVSIKTEAGFGNREKSGNQDGLKRCTLDLFNSSGAGEIMMGESYSNNEDSIMTIESPCLSIGQESTPEVWLEYANSSGAMENGDIPRMITIRADQYDKDNPMGHRRNENKDKSIPKEVQARIREIALFSAVTQSEDESRPINLMLNKGMIDYGRHCDDMKHEYRDTDMKRSIMYSRQGLKMWKITSNVSVFNYACKYKSESGEKTSAVARSITPSRDSYDEDSNAGVEELDIIKDEASDWARKFCEYEMKNLEKFFQSSGTDELGDIVDNYVLKAVARILNIIPQYKERQLHISKLELKRNNRMLPLSMLKRALRNKEAIKSLGKFGKDGFEVIIEYMVRSGYISIKTMREKKHIIALPDLIEDISDSLDKWTG